MITIELGAILHRRLDAMVSDATTSNSLHTNGYFAALLDAGRLDATGATASTPSKHAENVTLHASMFAFDIQCTKENINTIDQYVVAVSVVCCKLSDSNACCIGLYTERRKFHGCTEDDGFNLCIDGPVKSNPLNSLLLYIAEARRKNHTLPLRISQVCATAHGRKEDCIFCSSCWMHQILAASW